MVTAYLSQISQLWLVTYIKEGDHRRDGAFTIFYMGINIGSLLAGVIAGTASTVYGWKADSYVQVSVMTLSLIIQLLFAERLLGNIGKVPAAHRAAAMNKSGKQEPLTKVERDRLKVILVMCTFVIVFWAGFEQAGGLMNIYSQEYTNRMIGSFEVPAAWFQSLNPFFIIICAPILASIWVKMGKMNQHHQ